tara:strand:+ start:2245 stop:2766 length:522 start_codon:yes stop_codon:yes gene_type:complete
MFFLKIKSLNDRAGKGWFDKNDLYVKVTYNDEVRRTTTKCDNITSDPEWNESFLFKYMNQKDLKLELIDENVLSSLEVLTTITVPMYIGPVKEFIFENICIEMGNLFSENDKKRKELEEYNKTLNSSITDNNMTIYSLKSENVKLKDLNSTFMTLNEEYKDRIKNIKKILNKV